MARYNSITETVGRTPVVRINRLAPEGVNLWVKVEAFNPLGSVKDRLALGVIEAAERSGELKPGQTVVEMTSGNTGIGLAMVCAAKGYPLVIVMPESFSIERRKLMRFLGAKVLLTPAPLRATGGRFLAAGSFDGNAYVWRVGGAGVEGGGGGGDAKKGGEQTAVRARAREKGWGVGTTVL